MPIPLDSGVFHPERYVVEARDRIISLTKTEAHLLAFLASRPNAAVPYQVLLAEVWGYHEGVQSRTVYTTVNRLRAKIEVDPKNPRQILPVPAVGYRFVPTTTEPTTDEGPDDAALQAIAGALDARTRVEPTASGDRLVVEHVHVPADLVATLRASSPAPVPEIQAQLKKFLKGAWNLSVRTVAAGDVIVREGEPGQDAFIIRSGACRVSRLGLGELRRLGPGDVFGELAILSGGVRTATVEAVTDVELRVVSREVLVQGLGLDTWVGGFVAALVARFAELEGRLSRAAER